MSSRGLELSVTLRKTVVGSVTDRQTYVTIGATILQGQGAHVLSDSSPPSCAESWQLKRQKHAITHLSERRRLTTHQHIYITDSPNPSQDFLRLPWACLSLDTSNQTHRGLEPQILKIILHILYSKTILDTDWPTTMYHVVRFISPGLLMPVLAKSMLFLPLLNFLLHFHWTSAVR